MHRIVNDEALDTLFRAARSHYAWLARPVGDTLLRALCELVKLGPSGGATRPARLVFVRSPAARARLAAAVPVAQREALISAPVAAVIGQPIDAAGLPGAARDAALHAAYLIMAGRALGLDCGPLWDFDARLVAATLFPEGDLAASFVCALGYGDEAQPAPPEARAGLEEACPIL